MSEVGVFTTRHVLEGEPIVRVYHDLDGDWQFMASVETAEDDGRLVGLNHIIELDGSIQELLDLPMGWYAHRDSSESPWSREVYEHYEESTDDPWSDETKNKK